MPLSMAGRKASLWPHEAGRLLVRAGSVCMQSLPQWEVSPRGSPQPQDSEASPVRSSPQAPGRGLRAPGEAAGRAVQHCLGPPRLPRLPVHLDGRSPARPEPRPARFPQVYQLGGICKLVDLLRSPNQNVQQAAAGALRNLVFRSTANKLETRRQNGIREAVSLLRRTGSAEIQKQLTGGGPAAGSGGSGGQPQADTPGAPQASAGQASRAQLVPWVLGPSVLPSTALAV